MKRRIQGRESIHAIERDDDLYRRSLKNYIFANIAKWELDYHMSKTSQKSGNIIRQHNDLILGILSNASECLAPPRYLKEIKDTTNGSYTVSSLKSRKRRIEGTRQDLNNVSGGVRPTKKQRADNNNINIVSLETERLQEDDTDVDSNFDEDEDDSDYHAFMSHKTAIKHLSQRFFAKSENEYEEIDRNTSDSILQEFSETSDVRFGSNTSQLIRKAAETYITNVYKRIAVRNNLSLVNPSPVVTNCDIMRRSEHNFRVHRSNSGSSNLFASSISQRCTCSTTFVYRCI
eukprot:256994_1